MSALVSVVVSSYNYERFLRSAIDSALAQTHPEVEVIVVDDGSTDGSPSVIAGYGERVVPILKENGGQASALNAGFAAARGDVVLFLDSDDVLLPDAAARAGELLLDAEVMKVHWPLWRIDGNGRREPRTIPDRELQEGDMRETLEREGPAGCPWPPTTGNAWSRRFLEEVMPIPEAIYRTCPDLYLAPLAVACGRIAKVAEPQGCWRVHGSNATWAEPLEQRVASQLEMWGDCCRRVGERLRVGDDVLERWRANSFWYRIGRAAEEIAAVVPPDETIVLVDEDQWGTGGHVAGRSCLPFLERDGAYWGAPADDATAVAELERMREAGAGYVAFAWPAFWWLDHYEEFAAHLRDHYPCALESERLVVFELAS